MDRKRLRAPINTRQELLEHWHRILRGDPNPIEEQEKQGQGSFVHSDTLPVELNGARDTLESWGFEFLGPVEGDDIFQYVRMPQGWKKAPADHSMWSKLVDPEGCKRAAIFYKAAFYDRHASLYLEARFSVRFDYDKQEAENMASALVFDGEEIVHRTEANPLPDRSSAEYWSRVEKTENRAEAWLDARYPDWRNPAAYWEREGL